MEQSQQGSLRDEDEMPQFWVLDKNRGIIDRHKGGDAKPGAGNKGNEKKKTRDELI